MMFVCVLLLIIICPSVTSERFIYIESGDSLTLTCSFMGCLSSSDSYDGMYLYHEFIKRTEVLFSSNDSPGHTFSERQPYKGRIQTSSSFKNRSITISNLTVEDSGVYTCVYKKLSQTTGSKQCNRYIVVIKGPASHAMGEVTTPRNASCPLTIEEEKTTLQMLLVVLACLISAIMLLIVFLKVKQWKKGRKLRRDASQVSNVYEVMTKHGFREHVEDPEQISESPEDFAAAWEEMELLLR